jgi:hypothetical protein
MKAIEQMTTEEKLQAMEALWDSLLPVQDQVASPDWHGGVLQERAERAASGQATFSDWETAKARLSRPSS